MTDKIKSLSLSKENKTAQQLQKIRKEQMDLLKKIKVLEKQMSDMRNVQLMMIINLGRDSQRLALDTAILQRNVSQDPNENPYFYSRKEKLPQYADIAKKRTSMRMRGKNPGPWTSDLEEQELRSYEHEEGEDSTLAEVAKQMGQKKKPKRSMKRPKSRGKTRRRQTKQEYILQRVRCDL